MSFSSLSRKLTFSPDFRRKEMLLLALLGAVLGAATFLYIFPANVLNPTYESWLLDSYDMTQHYLGWKFYRQTPWQFPIGMIEGITYPDKISIIYTDSIPLLAIFFKILSPLLPAVFQYLGLHTFLCYVLMGVTSIILVRRYCANLLGCIFGSLIYLFCSLVLFKTFMHSALISHWLLIAALVVLVYREYFHPLHRRLIAWGVLFSLASMIHIYFLPMLAILLVADCFQDFFTVPFKRQLLNSLIMLTSMLPALLFMYLFGAFSAAGGAFYANEGLGLFSSNLNCLYNYAPGSNGIPMYHLYQYEGYGFLGCGGLLLVLLAIGIVVWRRFHAIPSLDGLPGAALIFALVCSTIMALSPVVTFNEHLLFTIPYPHFIMNILSIFRCSGRFIWIVCYLIYFICITVLVRRPKKSFIVALCACALLQIFDPLGQIPSSRNRLLGFEEKVPAALYSPDWDPIGANYQHFVFIPYSYPIQDFAVGYEFGNFAVEHGMTLSSFYTARTNDEHLTQYEKEYIQELDNGNPRRDTVYVFPYGYDMSDTDWESILDIRLIDGLLIGTAK